MSRTHSRVACGGALLIVVLGIGAVGASPVFAGGSHRGTPVALRPVARETIGDLMRRQAATPPEIPTAGAEAERDGEIRQPERGPQGRNPAAPASSCFPLRAASSAAGGGAPAVEAASGVDLTFMGATLYGVNPTNSFPPDCMGAVGPRQFVVLVNGRLVSFDKGTGLADGALNVTPNVFFASIRNGFGTTDPRLRYDRLTARWFMVMINISTPTRILIAVSDSASAGVIRPSTAFTFFYIQHDSIPPAIPSSCYADFPTLGVDAHALYIGTNNSCGSITDGFVVRKSSLLGSGPMVVTAFRGLAVAGAGLFTPQGVDNDDPASTEGWFIGTDIGHFGQLDLRRVTDPGGTPSISDNLIVTVPATTTPIRVPHLGNAKGTNGYLDAIDDRLVTASLHRGRLWTCHNIGVDNTGVSTGTVTRDGSRWYELDVPVGGAPSLVQAGTVFASGTDQRFYWIPAIGVSGQGHALMGFSTASAVEYIQCGIARRFAGDSPGTMQTPSLYATTIYGYNPSANPGGPFGRRWGDYSYTSLDPIDDQTLWTVQQYCDTVGSYGVRVARALAPPPATPSALPDVPAGASPVAVSLTGATTAGSGFYDPGPDHAGVPPFHHLAVQVSSGGATGVPPVLLSASYVDPTTISLVLDASSATPNLPGQSYTIAVTNPDGQTASAAVLHVVPAPVAVPPGAPVAVIALAPIRPNPVAREAGIEFQLPRAARVHLGIYDLEGREIAVIGSGRFEAGRYRTRWSGRAGAGAAPAGIYFVRLEAERTTLTRRFVLAR